MLLLLLVGCGGDSEEHREPETIFQEQQELEGLYFTRTGEEVRAPLHKGIFYDDDTRELCFPAVACHNPDCPKRTTDSPYLFFIDDPSVVMTPEGKMGTDMNAPIRSDDPEEEALLTGHCPACLTERTPSKESRATWDDYSRYVRPYMPPETVRKMRKLDEERKKSEDAARRR